MKHTGQAETWVFPGPQTLCIMDTKLHNSVYGTSEHKKHEQSGWCWFSCSCRGQYVLGAASSSAVT